MKGSLIALLLTLPGAAGAIVPVAQLPAASPDGLDSPQHVLEVMRGTPLKPEEIENLNLRLQQMQETPQLAAFKDMSHAWLACVFGSLSGERGSIIIGGSGQAFFCYDAWNSREYVMWGAGPGVDLNGWALGAGGAVGQYKDAFSGTYGCFKAAATAVPLPVLSFIRVGGRGMFCMKDKLSYGKYGLPTGITLPDDSEGFAFLGAEAGADFDVGLGQFKVTDVTDKVAKLLKAASSVVARKFQGKLPKSVPLEAPRF